MINRDNVVNSCLIKEKKNSWSFSNEIDGHYSQSNVVRLAIHQQVIFRVNFHITYNILIEFPSLRHTDVTYYLLLLDFLP